MNRNRDYDARREVNEASRNKAGHHREPWAGYEIEILEEWDGSEDLLLEIAELLGRTVEACRQRFYETRSGRGRRTVEKTVTETKTTTTRITWDDDDEWPSWYVRG